MSKPGVPQGDTYVVCLDCGKQFTYDWNKMRIGKPVESTAPTGVLHPETAKPLSAKLKWGLLASAVPLVFLIGNALRPKRRALATKGKNAAASPDQASTE